jgi:hypothetical protein
VPKNAYFIGLSARPLQFLKEKTEKKKAMEQMVMVKKQGGTE